MPRTCLAFICKTPPAKPPWSTTTIRCRPTSSLPKSIAIQGKYDGNVFFADKILNEMPFQVWGVICRLSLKLRPFDKSVLNAQIHFAAPIRMIGGQVGMVFAALSFTGALQAAIALFKAAQGPELGRKSWRTHRRCLLDAAPGQCARHHRATLFYLIYTHDYRFHYVWSHSSNELAGRIHDFLLLGRARRQLPACGPSGTAILGTIVLFTAKKWSEIVVSIIAAVNLILASMILGVYVPEWLG
jgi:hypothetical protein